MDKIRIRAQEIVQTVATEYPEGGEDALYQMAVDMKCLGWTQGDIDELLSELGF